MNLMYQQLLLKIGLKMSNNSIDKINQHINSTPNNSPNSTTNHTLPPPQNEHKLNTPYLCQWLSCKVGVIITIIISMVIFIGGAYLISNYVFDQTINQYLRKNHAISIQITLEGKNALKTFQKNAPSIANIKSMATIQRDLADYKDLTDKKYDMIYNMLSNSLTMVTIIIAVFGLLLGLFSFYLAAYISRKYEDISKLKYEVDILTNNADKVNEKFVGYYNEVEKFISMKEHTLYEIMEKHDTKLIIKRLKETPEFIKHVIPILIVRNDHEIWQDIYDCYVLYARNYRIPNSDISQYYFLFLLGSDSGKFFNTVSLLSEFTKNDGSNDYTRHIVACISTLSYPQLKKLFLNLTDIPSEYKNNFRHFISQILTSFSVICLFISFLNDEECGEIIKILHKSFGKEFLKPFIDKVTILNDNNPDLPAAYERYELLKSCFDGLEDPKDE